MKYRAAIVFFTTSCLSPQPALSFFPHHFFFFPVWWIGFQPLSVNAISRGSCPIPPQRHMCGDTDQRKTRHFRAMGLGCMQHKTSNGGLASDRYWCTVGLYDTEQADRHKHARQCSVSWNVKMIRPRTNSNEGSHRIHTIFVLTFMSFWVQLLFPVLFCAVYPHVSCCAPSRLSLGFPTLWLSSLVSPVPDLSHVYLGPRLCLALCQLVSFVLVSLCCSSWILPVFSGRVSFNCHQSVHVSFCCLYFCVLYFLDFFVRFF